jgi:small subunit ribosomal protein S3
VGQKIHPEGFRLGVNRTWSSRWFGKGNYADLLKEDMRIRDFVMKKYASAGVAKVEIERAARNMKVNVYSSRPGIIIGKKGAGAESLRTELIQKCKIKSGEPTLNVFDIKKPDLNAFIVGDNVRQQLERRVSFRRAMKKAIGMSMKNGAQGIRIECSGRLGGAEMSRRERYMEGRVPLHTLRAKIDYAQISAKTTYGIIGIKVWIYTGDQL